MTRMNLKPMWSLNHLVSVLSLGLVLLTYPRDAHAINFGSLIRQIGRVADDVPLNKVDDVAKELATSKAGRDLLRKGGVRIDDALERSRGLNRLLREAVGETNPSLLKQLDALDEPTREAALVFARGARKIDDAIPDLAMRSQFLRDGGAETVAALGRHPELVDDALQFDVALRAGRLTPPAGMRAVTLEDMGRFIRTGGDRAQRFWTTSVRPHWKLWLGGAALTAVLLTPHEYLDEFGNLTEAGLQKVGTFGGKVLAKALRGTVTGIGEGSKDVVGETVGTIARVFLSDVWGVVTLASLLLLAGFAIPLTRRLLIAGWRWITATKP